MQANNPGLTADNLGATGGRQTPLLAVFVPLLLVYVVDGRCGLRQIWLPAVVCGITFAVGQFPGTLLARLQAHRRWQAAQRFAAGPAWQELDFVFSARRSTDRGACRSAGVEGVAHRCRRAIRPSA